MLHTSHLDFFKECSDGGAFDNPGIAHRVYFIDEWAMLHVSYLDFFKASSDGGACDNPGIVH